MFLSDSFVAFYRNFCLLMLKILTQTVFEGMKKQLRHCKRFCASGFWVILWSWSWVSQLTWAGLGHKWCRLLIWVVILKFLDQHGNSWVYWLLMVAVSKSIILLIIIKGRQTEVGFREHSGTKGVVISGYSLYFVLKLFTTLIYWNNFMAGFLPSGCWRLL